MDARSVLEAKRDGHELDAEQIRFFLRGYVEGRIPDHIASALLMAIYLNGMTDQELARWTREMLQSGRTLGLHDRDGAPRGRPLVDKHSTGGVGDKTTIPLGPAVAACGAALPTISGRGLGHTGGTLDKLESIPGFRTDLTPRELHRVIENVGVVVVAQSAELVPADRRIYALRDVTGLVASIPLMASSILCKKLAEDVDALVLDVKFGSGAFLPDPGRGRELADVMIGLAARFGLRASALQTAMDRPLGRAIGHSLEVVEAIECLRGRGPADLRELVGALGGEMLHMVGIADDPESGRARIETVLDDGSALEVFARQIAAQDGDPNCVEDRSLLPAAPAVEIFAAPRAGMVGYRDVSELGLALRDLGGGRAELEQAIDPAVGLVALCAAGDPIGAGEPLFEIHHRNGRGLEAARARLRKAVRVGDPPDLAPLVLARIGE